MGRALHLLEVGVQWPPEAFVAHKLKGLSARGMRVTVASDQIRDPGFALPGVELLVLPGSASRAVARAALELGLRSPRRLARLSYNVRRVPAQLTRRHGGQRGLLGKCLVLALMQPDVVQFEWNVAAVDYLPLFDLWGCPVVTSCRGNDLNVYPLVPALSAYTDGLAEVMRRAQAVHCVSERLSERAASFGLDPSRARIIRPAVDPSVFRPRDRNGHPAGEFHVVSVGAMRWEKGHEYALAAVKRLVDDGVPVAFEIIGGAPTGRLAPSPSPEQQRIAHTISDLGLAEYVTVHPQALPAEIGRRVAAADVLLHASLTEGIPNVVLEAMACGTPVVSTDCGGVREALTDGVEGYVVDVRDPAQLAQALTFLWRDPALRARMGRAGPRKVQARFALGAQLDRFRAMYEELVA